jgi:hypothetical protein
MENKNKIKHSFASYTQNDGSNVCDTKEVAKFLAEGWANVPLRINYIRAMEIHLLAREYLKLMKGKSK